MNKLFTYDEFCDLVVGKLKEKYKYSEDVLKEIVDDEECGACYLKTGYDEVVKKHENDNLTKEALKKIVDDIAYTVMMAN